MYDPVLDETYRLFVKGMGYLQANHIYKFKDYSECIFDTQIKSKWWLADTLSRTKLIYHESPGYWLDNKVQQNDGFDKASSTKWQWSTKNWARVLKDSWFDMKLVFNPFASCSAQQYDAVSGGADGNHGASGGMLR